MALRPFYLCGPTASGKSALALQLAQECDGEIVNADAFQLYSGLDSITAAPSAEEQRRVPHHLYGVLAPKDLCDAQRYGEMAQTTIQEILSRGKIPIVTGGSGLYLKFLTHGPSPLPPGNPTLRAELDALPLEELVAELQRVDPVEAAQINQQNRRYVSRAVEIIRLSGRPVSEQRRQWEHVQAEKISSLRGVVLTMERSLLHQRIAQRTKQMLTSGAIDEVAQARDNLSNTCRKAIGIEQILDHLDGKISLARCEELIVQATRQYAKRQITWFQREKWLTPLEAPGDVATCSRLMRSS